MAWHPWGEAALARARDLDRPIFLSIGYSTCHWCHVMERESFEDEAVAELLNARFVSVTVDREERPDVDAVYLSAVQALNRGRAGWPLTLVLTPAGEPLFAASYLPRDELMRVLGAIDQAWRTDRDTVLADAGALTAHLVRIATPSPPADVPGPEAVDAGVAGLQEAWDRQHGGFGGAPKHPSPARLDLLLRTGTHEPAVHTLHAMIRGGIHDRIGGGFHRYATDVAWNEPHYEKRLGDNAQLLRTLIAAWQATGDATFREVAESTAAHLLRDLRLASGAFASALDADEAYYMSDRAGRPPPARDDKVVTAFNGLAISALSRASVALGRPDLAEAAEGATRTVVDTALTPAGRLHRTSSSAGVLEDYTFLAEGLLDLFEATSDPRHVVQAASLMDTVEARFRDPAGGWFRTPDDAEELVVRPRPTQDAAASGVHVLLRLHDLTGDARWQEAADRVLSSYARDLRDAPARWPALLAALDRRHDAPREIVIVWPEGADPAALADVVRARFLPNATLVRLPEPAIKEAGWVVPWIAGKVPRDDKPTAYVCERGSCRQPTTDPEVLSQQLSAP